MKTSDFFYDLPKELIAQSPAAVRSSSRLLVYDRANKTIRDGVFTDILDYFRPGDVLVRNITRVIPARLHAYREDTGGAMEFLLLRRLDENRWECLVRPGPDAARTSRPMKKTAAAPSPREAHGKRSSKWARPKARRGRR